MDDLITRKTAINTVKTALGLLQITERVVPKQKTGVWIKMSDSDGVYCACSQCGEDLPRIEQFEPPYCPNCGAWMKMTDYNGVCYTDNTDDSELIFFNSLEDNAKYLQKTLTPLQKRCFRNVIRLMLDKDV